MPSTIDQVIVFINQLARKRTRLVIGGAVVPRSGVPVSRKVVWWVDPNKKRGRRSTDPRRALWLWEFMDVNIYIRGSHVCIRSATRLYSWIKNIFVRYYLHATLVFLDWLDCKTSESSKWILIHKQIHELSHWIESWWYKTKRKRSDHASIKLEEERGEHLKTDCRSEGTVQNEAYYTSFSTMQVESEHQAY